MKRKRASEACAKTEKWPEWAIDALQQNYETVGKWYCFQSVLINGGGCDEKRKDHHHTLVISSIHARYKWPANQLDENYCIEWVHQLLAVCLDVALLSCSKHTDI